jgi:hypothetical protein
MDIMFESGWYDIAVNIATIAFVLIVLVDVLYIAIHDSKDNKNHSIKK